MEEQELLSRTGKLWHQRNRAVPRKSRGSVSEGSKVQIEKEGFRLNSRSHVVGRGERENELAFLIPYTHPVPLPLFLPVGIRKNLLLAHVGPEGWDLWTRHRWLEGCAPWLGQF